MGSARRRRSSFPLPRAWAAAEAAGGFGGCLPWMERHRAKKPSTWEAECLRIFPLSAERASPKAFSSFSGAFRLTSPAAFPLARPSAWQGFRTMSRALRADSPPAPSRASEDFLRTWAQQAATSAWGVEHPAQASRMMVPLQSPSNFRAVSPGLSREKWKTARGGPAPVRRAQIQQVLALPLPASGYSMATWVSPAWSTGHSRTVWHIRRRRGARARETLARRPPWPPCRGGSPCAGSPDPGGGGGCGPRSWRRWHGPPRWRHGGGGRCPGPGRKARGAGWPPQCLCRRLPARRRGGGGWP